MNPGRMLASGCLFGLGVWSLIALVVVVGAAVFS